MPLLYTILDRVETLGNRLPHPTIIFVYLCFTILMASGVAAFFNVTAIHPTDQSTIHAVNLLSREGLARILTQTVSNFVGFAPVGTVLVAILGIGIAEKSGLLDTLLRATVMKASPKLMSFIIVLAGILSNIGQDAGYVVLIPLAAIVFKGAGRSPLVGIAAGFAGVSGGYSANLLLGPVDSVLAGITSEAAQIIDPNYIVNTAGNYYFMLASTFIIALTGTWVTEKLIAPKFEGDAVSTDTQSININQKEKQGLYAVGVFTLIFIICTLWGILPQNGFLLDVSQAGISHSPFLKGIVTVVAFYFAACGLIFGKVTGTLNSSKAITHAMESTMSTMSSYLVLTFFAAQFVNYFAWSNLGIIVAIAGANSLATLELPIYLLLILFILIASILNLLIGSASAKWALMAPVFVPMLMLLGLSPEATQVAYRIGDSSTNIITPLMPYFAVIMAYILQYKKDAGAGTITALMLPYSVAFLVVWSGLLTLWYFLNWPLGPGVYF